MSPAESLLQRQIRKSTGPDGQIDYKKMKQLVLEAYHEKETDRLRADRASRLVTEELETAMSSLNLQNMRFRAALDNMSQALALYDAEGHLVVANVRFGELFELPRTPCCLGAPLYKLLENSGSLGRGDAMEHRLLAMEIEFLNRVTGAETEQTWPDGRVVWVSRRPVGDGGFLDTIADITDYRKAEARLAHMAHFDALTDLPNRVSLRERLREELARASVESPVAVLCLDLDRFKLVNDTLGHAVGDQLLKDVTRRLQAAVREGDIVARLGGDEFAIVQRGAASQAPESLARRIKASLCSPFLIGDHQVQIGVSIGIECATGPERDADEVLRNSDLALYAAKRDGGAARVYDSSLHQAADERRLLELDLRRALDMRQIEVHYQPQIDIRTGELKQFEALVRWRHPERGLVPPTEFIPLSEEVGLIDRLGAYVLYTACRDAADWPAGVSVAVNLSALQFRNGQLVNIVRNALAENRLEPHRLELEITEGVMLTDSASVLDQLRQLKRVGVRISLDDFGTGYSSLSYIRNFPFDKIKIDQSFVRELGDSPDSLAIIRAVAGMCSSLGIATTAEGVETEAQLAILAREKCDSAQGWLFGKAVPLVEARAMFAAFPLRRAA